MRRDFFSETFLLSVPREYPDGMIALAREFDRFQRASEAATSYDDYVEEFGILQAFLKSINYTKTDIPVLTGAPASDVSKIMKFYGELGRNAERQREEMSIEERVDGHRKVYADLFARAPAYEFTEDDFKKVQSLISELRNLIGESKLITPDHQRRLLKRLEAMQGELHKRTSDIDRFWGFIGEAGIVVRKFGEDVKPIADRVQQLGAIVIAVIMAKEGIKALPEISKLLLHK